MMPEKVDDAEILFRSVNIFYVKVDNGVIRPTSQAFGDRNRKVSVDRAMLCDNNPLFTQKMETDSVLQVSAEDIRQIGTVTDQDKTKYAIDVIPAS